MVNARRLTARINAPEGLVTALPAASALNILAVGCALTVQAAPALL